MPKIFRRPNNSSIPEQRFNTFGFDDIVGLNRDKLSNLTNNLSIEKGLTDFMTITGMKNYFDIMDEIGNTKSMNIEDKRVFDGITKNLVKDTERKHAEVPQGVVYNIAKAALKNREDPYTWLAIALQETNLDWDNWSHNIFHIKDNKEWEYADFGGLNKPPTERFFQPVFDFWKEKKNIARSLGKKTEAEKLQVWNGYGTILPKSNEYNATHMYGLPLPINLDERPVYGERVLDLRDNVIKANPMVVKMVEFLKER